MLGGKLRLEAQAVHAHDGVHWRADLMAHVGQELTLGLVCLLCHQLGAREFPGSLIHQLLEVFLVDL